MPHPVCDFSRSFLTFRLDFEKKAPATVSHRPPYSLNNARIQIECRCRLTDKRTGEMQTFVLGASCKTERVGVDHDIWTEPNADFALMMIPHHQSAIDMAEAYLEHGDDPELTNLANEIIAAQQQEIEFLQNWLEESR